MAESTPMTALESVGMLPAEEVAVSARDVHVIYRVYEDRRPSLRRLVSERFTPRPSRQIHALRGVSFEVGRGEAVGVIGPNGSGKSTLLRTLAGLLPVTEGAIYARGHPALLGVGAVLQGELSGRRNIVLGSLALGMSRSTLNERMDDIIQFSGLRDSIDLPLKTYSSGMRARLHFAVATAVSPEILLIDEALAVGDAEFSKRSERRISELLSDAGTVFIVTHNLRAIRHMCTRALWLQGGKILADGPPNDVADAYSHSVDEDHP